VKDRVGIIIAVVSGLLFLAALFFQPVTAAWLNLILNWVIVVTAVGLMVSVARLIATHLRHIAVGRRGFLFSMIFIIAFSATLIAGIFMGEENPEYLRWIRAIQVPLETALLGLVALVMMSVATKVFRERGWSFLTLSFGFSALVFLFLNLGFLRLNQDPSLGKVVAVVQGLPMAGARGLLIGIALGALFMGLRMLFGQVVEND
jgi:hypothetical protein